MTQTHSVISPAILYWGTPVVLVSSENEDGTHNLCAISSAFWLGHRCVLGFGAGSKTPQNILRTGQCVVCLPNDSMVAPVNALASTTGSEHPSPSKLARGYRFVKDKWSCADLTPQPADLVRPARVRECPVQMECELACGHPLMEDVPDRRGVLVAIELQVLRVHVHDKLRMEGHANRIDPDKWRPMIMSFQELYGLSEGKAGESHLARIDEEKYRAVTRSSVVKRPGDEDKEMAEAKQQSAQPNGHA
ncbi:hypothetical protein PLIIFM63780_005890 [Purpureocillium lilacinum]|nr:hypothetical protein PLIIFM63780_005890 [Purpureocillium lilacinum]